MAGNTIDSLSSELKQFQLDQAVYNEQCVAEKVELFNDHAKLRSQIVILETKLQTAINHSKQQEAQQVSDATYQQPDLEAIRQERDYWRSQFNLLEAERTSLTDQFTRVVGATRMRANGI